MSNLNKDTIVKLLEKADVKWHQKHSGEFKYREHLEFTASFITDNYERELKKSSKQ